MGRLGNQPRRSLFDTDLADFIGEIRTAANKMGVSFDQALKAAEIKEMKRKNDLFIEGGDFHDEHMGGFGEILEQIALSIEQIASVYDRLHPLNEY